MSHNSKYERTKSVILDYNIFVFFGVYSYTFSHLAFAYPRRVAGNLPFINAFLTKAVSTRQDEVSSTIHTDTTLLLISQLLHPAM